MTRTLLTALAGAALLLGPLAAAQAQVRLNPPKSNLPTGGGFAVKNGGAFANQGGIAAQAGGIRTNGLIGENTGTWMKPNNGAGILSHNGGLMRPR